MSDDPILDVRSVAKTFGGLVAVSDATFTVERGTITALIGPNGAGKTTLFNIVTGFFRPERGHVIFDQRTIERLPPYAIARRGMVRTFQLTKALTKMSVLDNMMLAAPDQPGEHFWNLWFRPGSVRRREEQVRARALELLEIFSLTHLVDEYAGALSGGQRKLLELARALMVDPAMVLLDEPMAGVNPTLGRRLMDHITTLRDEHGTTFLFIEHDMDVVMRYGEKVIVMADGSVIASGSPAEIQNDQAVIDAYLGTTGGATG